MLELNVSWLLAQRAGRVRRAPRHGGGHRRAGGPALVEEHPRTGHAHRLAALPGDRAAAAGWAELNCYRFEFSLFKYFGFFLKEWKPPKKNKKGKKEVEKTGTIEKR